MNAFFCVLCLGNALLIAVQARSTIGLCCCILLIATASVLALWVYEDIMRAIRGIKK